MKPIVVDSMKAVKRSHAATLDNWTYKALKDDLQRCRTATLVQQVDELAHLPLPLRVACWGWLGAAAMVLGDRALAAETDDDDDLDGAA